MDGPLGLLTFANGQLGLCVQAEYPLVIHAGEVLASQVMRPSVTEAATLVGNIDDARSQRLRLLTGDGRVAKAASAEPYKSAGAALGEFKLLHHLADGFALDQWG